MAETKIDHTIGIIVSRGAQPIAPEPFNMEARFRALYNHWWHLIQDQHKPEPWEEAHDTTFLPPLLKARGIGDDSGKDVSQGVDIETHRITLPADMQAEADRMFAEWLKDRNRKLSYFREHPPHPLAWHPVPRTNEGKQAAWEDIFEDGVFEVGRKVSEKLLGASTLWKPSYRGINQEHIPYDWVAPGEAELTDEEFKKWNEEFDKRFAKQNERKDRQKAYQNTLKQERDMKRQEEEEEMQRKQEL
jgi:hypothetical protein